MKTDGTKKNSLSGQTLALISIIVPVYNVESYLPRCLDSLLAQTYANLEIILVDDGAQDASGRICDEYAQKDKRIAVFHRQNEGVSAARNHGIERASGDFIGFVDADDWIAPDMLATLAALLIETGQKIAACNYTFVEKGIERENRLPPFITGSRGVLTGEDCYNSILQPHTFQCYSCNKLMERSLFAGDGGVRYDTGLTLCEDMPFIVQLVNKAGAIAYTTKSCYFYFIRPGSKSNEGWKTQVQGLKGRRAALSVLPPAYAAWDKAMYFSMLPRLSYAAYGAGDGELSASLRREFAGLSPDYRRAYRQYRGHFPKSTRLLVWLASRCYPLGRVIWKMTHTKPE